MNRLTIKVNQQSITDTNYATHGQLFLLMQRLSYFEKAGYFDATGVRFDSLALMQ